MYRQAEEALSRAAQPIVDAIARREKRASRLTRPVLAEIRGHFYAPDYSVCQLKRALGMRDWAMSVFGKEIGLTPWRFIQHCRMELAARLLRDTSFPVADVGIFVGYNDKSAFLRVFRRWSGIGPARYRGRARKLKGRLHRPPEEVFTWSYWRRCRASELKTEEVRELAEYLEYLI